jgi:hypothetical protein
MIPFLACNNGKVRAVVKPNCIVFLRTYLMQGELYPEKGISTSVNWRVEKHGES